jgi:hypothetical protein
MLALALLLLQLAPSGVEGETPVELPMPAGVDASKPWKLVRSSDRREIAAQSAGASLVFLTLHRNDEYQVVPGKPADFPKVDCVDSGRTLTLRVAGRDVLRYNHAVIEQPDPLFSRSGYLHPVWTPGGRIVTNDSPPNHLHHHGIWSAWTSAEFEGRKSNFWESKEKQGRVECVKIEETVSGPVFGGFRARHRFVNLNAPDGPKVALEEVWDVRVYALSDRFVFDLVSTQTAATDAPLVIKEYRYGGIGFRGAPEWEGKSGSEFLTSEGRTRVDGHATRAKWVVESGKIGGAQASIGFLCHPSDFRFPQPLRIHPDEPFFNWAVPQGGDFSIEPGKPYTARYRFIVADGPLKAGDMDAAWAAYGEGPQPAVTAAK